MAVRLIWKLEEGEGDLATGPAWIDTIGAGGRITQTEHAADGEWINRRQAQELAEQHGWELVLDTGDDHGRGDHPAPVIDAREVNQKLRELGIAEEDLRVGEDGDALLGLWLDRLPGVEAPRTVRVPGCGDSIVRTGAITRTPAELRESLDSLAPGWREL